MNPQVLLVIPLVLGLAFGASVQDEKPMEEVVTEASSVVPEVVGLREEILIKYPTVPEDDTPTPAPPPDLDEPSIPRMTEQAIITGSADCICGRGLGKIVGGENASIQALPWTVALIRKRKDGTWSEGPYCGGTLICDRYVATASHCVDGFEAENIQVWLLEEDFNTEDENPQPTIKKFVQQIIMHPEYNSKKIDNDIALLKLDEPVIFTGDNYLRPVCLPADNENTYEEENAVVAGWGATEMGGDVSPTLQRVTVPVITNKQCNWRTLYLGKITDNMLCAGEIASGGKDSCQGDSGGPLVIERNNRYLLAGIVSFGYGCAQPYAPGVYTRVGRYPAWIQENTQDCQYCSK